MMMDPVTAYHMHLLRQPRRWQLIRHREWRRRRADLAYRKHLHEIHDQGVPPIRAATQIMFDRDAAQELLESDIATRGESA